MQNIEIKAAYPDSDAGKRRATEIGARYEATLLQIDTYFSVPHGRLKLREIDGGENQLIFYDRADSSGPKVSEYQICPVADAGLLKATLGPALGIWCVVEKQRDLYLYDEVRIHFDEVRGLGRFIELEGVVSGDANKFDARKKVEFLVAELGIPTSGLVEGSYSDLLGGFKT